MAGAARRRPLHRGRGGGDLPWPCRRAARRECGARGGAGLRRGGGGAGKPPGAAGAGAAIRRAARGACAAGRPRSGVDGPWRHDLHATPAGLRAVPLDGRVRGAPARRAGGTAAQGREGGARRPARGALPAARRAGPPPVAPPARGRAAGRHAGNPRYALARHAVG